MVQAPRTYPTEKNFCFNRIIPPPQRSEFRVNYNPTEHSLSRTSKLNLTIPQKPEKFQPWYPQKQSRFQSAYEQGFNLIILKKLPRFELSNTISLADLEELSYQKGVIRIRFVPDTCQGDRLDNVKGVFTRQMIFHVVGKTPSDVVWHNPPQIGLVLSVLYVRRRRLLNDTKIVCRVPKYPLTYHSCAWILLELQLYNGPRSDMKVYAKDLTRRLDRTIVGKIKNFYTCFVICNFKHKVFVIDVSFGKKRFFLLATTSCCT
jgi:hypothetical protein